MAVDKRYPLSTADGQAIPLDVVRPYSLVPLNIGAEAGSPALQIPTDIDMFSIQSSVDCYIQFSASAVAASALVYDTENADTLFVPCGLLVVGSPPLSKSYYSVRALVSPGIVYLQFLTSWTGLALQSQIPRR